MAKFAYARTLQRGPSLSKQIQDLSQFCVPKSNIFVDEQPASRASFVKLLQSLKKGDLLVIKTLLVLNEGYEKISRDWTRIAGTIGADVCVLDLPALDTRAGDDRSVVVSAVSQLLDFCAEKERAHSALQAKGIQSARQRGVKFWRPPKQYSKAFITTVERFCKKEITLEEALAATKMKQSSFYYHKHKLELLGLIEGSAAEDKGEPHLGTN